MIWVVKRIARAKPTVRKPRMYLKRDRICCKCGSNVTNDKLSNRILWHSDIDQQGKWTGKWKCNKCYNREYAKNRRLEADIMRKMLLDARDKGLKELQIMSRK